jgi:hypothetical protein
MIVLRSSEADLSEEFRAMVVILFVSASRKELHLKPQRQPGGGATFWRAGA